MKRTLLLLTLCVAALCANAQDHKRPAGRDVLSHRQQLALTQTAQSKAAFEYRLDNFYASDDYEYVNYFYTPEGRCIAIETSYGYVGWNDYLHTFDSLRYDANGDMVRLDCYQEMDTGWAYVNYCEYTYENHLLASRENYNWLGGQFELGGRYVFSYNAQGQMTQSKLWFFNEWYDQTDYTYDAQGHLTQVLYKVDINFNGVLVDYERTDYTLNEAGLPTVESIYQADQYNIMRLVVRNTYEYDANGNCTLYESKNGSGAWREKKEFVYEERLLSETYIPHTYEHPNPNTYHNLNTYSSMHYWAADDNYVLQDVCFYYY